MVTGVKLIGTTQEVEKRAMPVIAHETV